MNHKCKYILYFLLITLSFADQSKSKKELIDQSLNHATTYYWLARYKDSNSEDFLKAKEWYQKTIKIINNDSLVNHDDIRAIALKGLSETDIRFENNFDNIHNDYPLYDIINKNTPTYEFYDDPDVAAATYSIEGVLDVLQFAVPKEDIQMMAVVISDPSNFSLEDELRFTINTRPQYFTRPAEEILSSISEDALNSLYQFPQDPKTFEIFDKLAEDWNQRHIMIFKLIENDIVEDVYYYGTWAYMYDRDKGEIIKSVYSDGFAEDKRHTKYQKLIFLSIILVFSALLPLFYYYIYSLIFKTNAREIYFYTGIFSFLATFVIIHLIIAPFNLWAPNASTLSILPISRLWILSFTFLLAFLPMILIYFIGSKIKGIKDRLSDGETLSCLAAGIFLGDLSALGLFYLERYELFSLLNILALQIIPIAVLSIYLGFGISVKFYNNINKHLFSIPLFLFVLYLLNIALLSNNLFYLYLGIFISLALPLCIFIYKNIKSLFFSQEVELSGANQNFVLDKDSYKKVLQNPHNFINPVIGENIRKKYSNYLIDPANSEKNTDSKLKTILITGKSGCGKTRLANEIAQFTINNFNKLYNIDNNTEDSNNWILFGDCDEMTSDGSGVPFEPFSQAMHTVLGAGRFEPPTKRANKIKAGFEKLGMDEALGAAGLGIMNSILGSGNEEEVTAATSVEMADIVEKSLLKLSEKRAVVFIIDDTHWIDDQTFALFKELLKRLSSKSKVKNLSLIITAHENYNSNGPGRCAKMLKTFGPNKLISMNEISNNDFLGPDRYEEFLSRALYFNNQSAAKIMRYLNKYDVTSIAQVIRLIKTIDSKNGLMFTSSQVSIKNDFQISTLKPPSDTMLQVADLLVSLDPQEKRIIECAAFIGSEVNASTLSVALQISRLETLVSLRRLEKKGLIKDILDQDDVYSFTSSSFLNGVRYITSNYTSENNNISQIVKEYQRRITTSLEKKFNIDINSPETIDNIRDHTIFKLAKRSMAAGEVMLDRALFYNKVALDRSLSTKFYFDSINFGKNILDISEKINNQIIDDGLSRSIFATLTSMTNTNHPPKKIYKYFKRSRQIFKNSQGQELNLLKLNNLFTDSIIHDFSNYYSSKIKDNVKKELNELVTKIDNKNNRLELYFAQLSLHRLNSNDNNSYDVLEKLLKDVDKVSEENIWFKKRLKSEIIEEIIKILPAVKNPNRIKEIFELGISLKREIDDQEGLCQLLIFKSDYLFNLGGDLDVIEKYYLEAESISKNIGSMDFASDSHSGLGKIYYKKKDYEKSLSQFSKACVESKIDDNIINQYVALIGIHKIITITKDKEIFIEFSDEVEHVISKDTVRGKDYSELNELVNNIKDSL